MNEENQQIDIETLKQLLGEYFYSKDEQNELSSKDNEITSSNTEQIITSLKKIEDATVTQVHLLYLDTVILCGVLLWTLYYKFLKNFIERWY